MNGDAVLIFVIVLGVMLIIADFYVAHGIMHYVNRRISNPVN